MKLEAQKHRFDGGMHEKPPNWWGAQAYAAKYGLAPDPWDQVMYALLDHERCDRRENGATVTSKGLGLGDLPALAQKDASEWFLKNVDVFVINLPSNVHRMRVMAGRLGQLKIPFTRVNGVDMRGHGALERAKRDGLVPEAWSFQDAKTNIERQHDESNTSYGKKSAQEMGLGTVGCTAAHLNAMKVAAMSKKPLALVLEDDTYLNDGFVERLHALVREEVPCDWEAINLDLYMPYGKCISPHLLRVHPDGNEPKEVCRTGSSWSFAAMLYRVSHLGSIREQLRQVVWNVWRPSCIVHDVAFASIADRIKYYAVPAQQYPGFVSISHVEGDVDREAINA